MNMHMEPIPQKRRTDQLSHVGESSEKGYSKNPIYESTNATRRNVAAKMKMYSENIFFDIGIEF